MINSYIYILYIDMYILYIHISYKKLTDMHQYLHASSCHVYHSKRSIPYSQALRLNRICSENSFYSKSCNELEVWLRERGYSVNWLDNRFFEPVNERERTFLTFPLLVFEERKIFLKRERYSFKSEIFPSSE